MGISKYRLRGVVVIPDGWLFLVMNIGGYLL
jgi:hypothetical protein